MFGWLKYLRREKQVQLTVAQAQAIKTEVYRQLLDTLDARQFNASLAAQSARTSPETPLMRASRLWARAPKWAVPKFNATMRVIPIPYATIRDAKLESMYPRAAHIVQMMRRTGKPHYTTGKDGNVLRYICKDKHHERQS